MSEHGEAEATAVRGAELGSLQSTQPQGCPQRTQLPAGPAPRITALVSTNSSFSSHARSPAFVE